MMLPFNKTSFAEIPSQHLNIVLFVFLFVTKRLRIFSFNCVFSNKQNKGMLRYDGSDFFSLFCCFTFRCSEVTLTEIPSSRTLYFVHSKHNMSVFTLKPGEVTYP